MSAALLTAALAVACTRAQQNAENAPAPEAAPLAPAAEPAPPGAPGTAAPAAAPAAPQQASRPASAPQRPASAPAPPERPTAPPPKRFREVTAQAGTPLSLELTTALTTETAKVEQPVTARLRSPVVIDGITVLPAGAILHGNITETERSARVKGRAHMSFRFTEVSIDGQREPLTTEPLAFEADPQKGKDAAKVGIGAGIGAAIGAIAGGGSGAATGAAIGAGAGVGTVLATRGQEVELAAGTELKTSLASSFGIRVEQ